MQREPSSSETRQRCAWCGRPWGEGATRLAGRVRCPACGVATTDPWPTDAELETAYGDWYRPESARFLGAGDRILRRSRGLLARRIDKVAPEGRVLDVGAGDGALLDALRATGRDPLGIERHSTRPDVVNTPLGELEGPFAAVVFWHSLEHLRDPAAALHDSARLLAPRGLLVIAAPNSESLQAFAFRDRWLALDLPRHLVHIPASALVERVELEGLTVQRVGHLRGGQVVFGWLHGLVNALPGQPDLYDAIRRPAARSRPMTAGRRVATLAAGGALLPAALAATAVEVGVRRGGSVYIEARR